MRLFGKIIGFTGITILVSGLTAQAQMIDNTQATNTAGASINKSLSEEIGASESEGFAEVWHTTRTRNRVKISQLPNSRPTAQ